MSVELLLQSFIRVVDADLFEAVDLERFKTENIQDTDGGFLLAVGLGSILDTGVDLLDIQIESSSVYGLGQGLACLSGFFDSEWLVLCTVSSAAMIDLDVRAAERPSNVIPRSAAHARAAFVLSSLQESPSADGVKLMFPANIIAETEN